LEASPFNTQSYIQWKPSRASVESLGKEVFRLHDRREKMSWWDPRRWLEWLLGQIALRAAPFRVFFVSLPDYWASRLTRISDAKQDACKEKLEAMMLRLFISLTDFVYRAGCRPDSKAVVLLFVLRISTNPIDFIPIALASIYRNLNKSLG
jgi:hypothetical protein